MRTRSLVYIVCSKLCHLNWPRNKIGYEWCIAEGTSALSKAVLLFSESVTERTNRSLVVLGVITRFSYHLPDECRSGRRGAVAVLVSWASRLHMAVCTPPSAATEATDPVDRAVWAIAVRHDDGDADSADTWSNSTSPSGHGGEAAVAEAASALGGVAVEGSSDVKIGGTHIHVAAGSRVTLALPAVQPADARDRPLFRGALPAIVRDHDLPVEEPSGGPGLVVTPATSKGSWGPIRSKRILCFLCAVVFSAIITITTLALFLEGGKSASLSPTSIGTSTSTATSTWTSVLTSTSTSNFTTTPTSTPTSASASPSTPNSTISSTTTPMSTWTPPSSSPTPMSTWTPTSPLTSTSSTGTSPASSTETSSSTFPIPRADWGARDASDYIVDLPHPIRLIVGCHVLGWGDCDTEAECANVAGHMDRHKYPDIIYNFVVGGDGSVFEGRGWSLQSDLGYYSKLRDSMSVAVIGGSFDRNSWHEQGCVQRLVALGKRLDALHKDVRYFDGDEMYHECTNFLIV
ncbi:mucin-5AC-like isoform X2 [Frankliniella occidentalis]|uniref:Mucin-5AC-like isoform X2 n=1 Tax=Frankliniella occidentalis TaxID=133901 RepID=A0A9C6X9V2_FRAOC|nr:mucin-5AC-like isoform X2 [Frankliniella occidentalis]